MRIAALALVACIGCRDSRKPVEATPPATTTAAVAPLAEAADTALLENLAKLAVGTPPPPELLEGARRQPVEVFIDALIASPMFSDYAARALVLGSMIQTPNEAALELLKLHDFETEINGKKERIFHLLEKCDAKDAVQVQPWWGTEKVWICAKSYEPTHLIDPETHYRCGSKNQTDQLRNLAALESAENQPITMHSYCGCGPSLVFCTPDDEIRQDVLSSLENEATDTIANVVKEDRPIEDAFTKNETFRDSKADFFYQRTLLLQGVIKKLPPVDKSPPKWQPRRDVWPGQNAGVLTTMHMLHLTDGVRDRMRDYFLLLWCKDRGSHGATAEQVFALGVTSLRNGDGWQKLAAMPLCTNCHARLDYGMQFFNAYPSSYIGFFDAHKPGPAATGPLYGEDTTDLRGTGELTPSGFAKIVTTDPEFGRCVVSRVAHHVLGDGASPEDLKALEDVFAKTHRLKPVVREALERFAKAWTTPNSGIAIAATAAAKPPAAAVAALPAATSIAIAPPLRQALDKQCGECHDDSAPKERDFSKPALERGVVAEMLHRVAWGDMPRHAIKREERVQISRMLLDALWPTATPERAAAERYYFALHALPTHVVTAVRAVMQPTMPEFGLEQYVNADQIEYTPGFVSAIAKTALAKCSGHSGADLQACLHEEIAAVHFVNRRLPWLTK